MSVSDLLDDDDPLDDPLSAESIAAYEEERARRRLKPEPPHLVAKTFHYTFVSRLPAILETGELRPLGGLLWFTKTAQFDGGAELYVADRTTHMLTRATTADEVHRDQGLARFQVAGPVPGLLDWPAVCVRQDYTRAERIRVERWARMYGADVRNWYATPLTLPISATRVQTWDGEAWRTCTPESVQRLARWRDLLTYTNFPLVPGGQSNDQVEEVDRRLPDEAGQGPRRSAWQRDAHEDDARPDHDTAAGRADAARAANAVIGGPRVR